MNLALKEAEALQIRIDALNEKIDNVKPEPANKELTEKLETFKLAFQCIQKDIQTLEREHFNESQAKDQAMCRVRNELITERDVFIASRDVLLEHAKQMTQPNLFRWQTGWFF